MWDWEPCRTRHRFEDWAAAGLYARMFNTATGYRRPVTLKRCRRCDGWHVVPARTGRQFRNIEKGRRKWRQQQMTGSTARI